MIPPAAGFLLLLAPSTSAATLFQEGERLLARVPTDRGLTSPWVRTADNPLPRDASPFVWGAGGRVVAYAADLGAGGWAPVIVTADGETVGAGDEPYEFASRPVVAGGRAFFHVARRASEDTQTSWLWIDGKTFGPEDWMGELAASPDGSRVAFWTQPGAIVGNSVRTSPARQHLAVATEKGAGRWRVAHGDRWSAGSYLPPLFSTDGRAVFSSASKSGWRVFRGGTRREKELSDKHPNIGAIAVSADGGEVAFAVVPDPSRPLASQLYFKGKRLAAEVDGLSALAVDARGRHVAYGAPLGAKRTVRVDDQAPGPARFSFLIELAFDPAGQRLAFLANEGGRRDELAVEGGRFFVVERAVEDAQERKRHADYTEVRNLVWSPDGTRLAYCALDDDGWRLVCGDSASESHDEVGRPFFAADSGSVGYGSRDGDELWWRTLSLP
ncbi:MAG: hypothetical protein AAF682_22085 [Planctomycetota bacterium]